MSDVPQVPRVAQKGPFITQELSGARRAWCTCGFSLSQPFCDGRHREKNTGMRSMPVVCEKGGEYAWCGCKQSKNPPYCDGSHAQL